MNKRIWALLAVIAISNALQSFIFTTGSGDQVTEYEVRLEKDRQISIKVPSNKTSLPNLSINRAFGLQSPNAKQFAANSTSADQTIGFYALNPSCTLNELKLGDLEICGLQIEGYDIHLITQGSKLELYPSGSAVANGRYRSTLAEVEMRILAETFRTVSSCDGTIQPILATPDDLKILITRNITGSISSNFMVWECGKSSSIQKYSQKFVLMNKECYDFPKFPSITKNADNCKATLVFTHHNSLVWAKIYTPGSSTEGITNPLFLNHTERIGDGKAKGPIVLQGFLMTMLCCICMLFWLGFIMFTKRKQAAAEAAGLPANLPPTGYTAPLAEPLISTQSQL